MLRADPVRASAPAPRRGAADRLHLRDLPRALRRRRSLPATGTRTVWLDGLELPDELWAAFRIPIGLAFFFASSAGSDGVVAFYPSPAGTTECELDLAAWETLVAANPVLEGLEPDVEALIVNRLGGRASTRSSRSTSATGSSGSFG